MLTPGHPAKDWWEQATEGERIYHVPPDVAPFTTPVPGSGVRGLGQGANPTQVQLLAELDNQVWSELTAAQDLLTQVAKYDSQLYDELALELQTFFDVASNLESTISQADLPIPQGEAEDFRGDIAVLSSDVRSFKMRVAKALRGGVESGQLNTALLGVVVGAAAVGLGWYVFRRAKRR